MDPKLLIGLVVLLQLAGNVVVGYDNNDMAAWNEYRFVFGNLGKGKPIYINITEGVIPKDQYSTDVNLRIGLGVTVTAVDVRVLAHSRPEVLYDEDRKEVTINYSGCGVDTLSLYQITAEVVPVVPTH